MRDTFVDGELYIGLGMVVDVFIFHYANSYMVTWYHKNGTQTFEAYEANVEQWRNYYLLERRKLGI